MSIRNATALLALISLTACSTYMPQRYSISADNNVALKAIEAGNINVGAFHGSAKFDSNCRAAGPIAPPDNMSFEAYIQKALADELKVPASLMTSPQKSPCQAWSSNSPFPPPED
jgi:hypothetical protein